MGAGARLREHAVRRARRASRLTGTPRNRLRVASGPAEGAEIDVGDAPFTIGRSEEGHGELGGDPEISRRHARVTARGSELFVEDLGSTNGTFVNGRRIEGATALGPGDVLHVGTTDLEVEAAEPEVSLEVAAGPGRGMRIAIGDAPFLIGRAEQAAGRLGDDPELSRRHAEVSRIAGQVTLEDLGSTNGTFVNGDRIGAATVLRPGDRLWMGDTTLVVVTPDHPAPDPLPGPPPRPAAPEAAAPTAPGAAAPAGPEGAAPAAPEASAPVEPDRASPPPAPPPPRAAKPRGLLGRVTDLALGRPKRVLAAVGLFFLVSLALGGPVAEILGENATGFEDPATESVKTQKRIAAAAGEEPGAQVIVLVRGSGRVESAAARRRVERIAAVVAKDRLVSRTLTFYNTRARSFVSKDGRSTFIAAFLRDSDEAAQEDAAVRIQDRVESPPDVVVGGGALAGRQVGDQVGKDLGKAEGLAFPLLFLVSLFVFRGVVAALLPLFVGILTIFGTFLVMRLVNQAVELSVFSLNIVIGLGLGLAIDYSLFMVSRYREELAKGADEKEALRRAIGTAGRTILFSAVTVAFALAALITFPQGFLYSMGIGGAACALVAVSVSLVALPALLALLGPRVNALAPARWQRVASAPGEERSGAWYRLSQTVMRRPGTVAGISTAVLLVLGLPALGIKFTGFDNSTVPSELTARQVDDTLRRDFGINRADITVLAEAPRSRRAEVERYAASLRRQPGANPGDVQPPRPLKGDLWVLTVTPKGSTLSEPSKDLVQRVRDGPSPFTVTVTGQTADFLDRQESLGSHLPLALLILCGSTVVALFLMTGSVVLPLKSLVMNFLSLSAAFGLLVLIFQDGRLEGLLDFESQGALESTQPVLLFALAFGLATDYSVFLLSRIREAREEGGGDRESVAIGLQRTGRIITQAAVLFCIAIGAFATSSVIFIKEVGIGTALAVIIDATIIRALLVPSLMALLGSRNWWAPAWLKRVHQRIGVSES